MFIGRAPRIAKFAQIQPDIRVSTALKISKRHANQNQMLPPNNVAADEKNFSLILKTVIIFQTKLIAESKGISKMKTT